MCTKPALATAILATSCASVTKTSTTSHAGTALSEAIHAYAPAAIAKPTTTATFFAGDARHPSAVKLMPLKGSLSKSEKLHPSHMGSPRYHTAASKPSTMLSRPMTSEAPVSNGCTQASQKDTAMLY